jgi:UDP-N-acetylglucosamine 2-epimerase (non-hydrolysing)
MKTVIIYGTRAEIIKLRSLIRFMPHAVTIHSGQQSSREMIDVFLDQLNVRKPDISLSVRNDYQVGLLAERFFDTLIQLEIERVIVQGDTNTALAGALAANALRLELVHIEAGLRCGTRMVEEQNRIVIDSLADDLFAPTMRAAGNLSCEGRVDVPVTGNTGIDAFLEFWPGHGTAEHHLLTLHRPENVDCTHCLNHIMHEMSQVAKMSGMPVMFPAHPRTRAANVYPGVRRIGPVRYVKMLDLLSKSAMVWTDSGGMQEEACAAGIPCVTIRESTERQESVEVGANIVMRENLADALNHVFPKEWNRNIYGNGKAGEKIVEMLSDAR